MANPDVLQPKKSAAIEPDATEDREIGQITAKDFLNILDKEGLGAGALSNVLPEKKKLELYTEPEWTKAIKVKDLVRVLKTEKKKTELEVPIDFGWRVNPPYASLNHALHGQYATQRNSSGGGAAGYPTDDQTHWWPPQIEMRKASLDHRFEMVSTQIAQLTVAMQDIKSQLDAIVRR